MITTDPTPAKAKAPLAGAHVASGEMVLDGAALGASALLTATAGLVGWLIVARTQTPAVVGVSSAFVNSFMLVAVVCELGTGPALLRWLPRAGEQTLRLLRLSYGCVIGASLVFATAWLLVDHRLSLEATAPLGTVAGGALFFAASLGWSLFHLQDQVLTGLRAARWVPVENVAFSVVRLVLLLVLGPALGALGIILSWVIPAVAGVLVVSCLLVLRARKVSGRGELPARKEVVSFVGPTYPAAVCEAVLSNVIPLIVVAYYGHEASAVFFIVWMGLNALEVATVGFGNALVVRLVGHKRDEIAVLRVVALRLGLILLPLLVIAFALSHFVLGLFGPTYASTGAGLLRWVLVGFVFRAVLLLITAIHLSAGRGVRMAVIQAIGAIAMVLVLVLLPISDLSHIGVGYVVVQIVLMVFALVDLKRLQTR